MNVNKTLILSAGLNLVLFSALGYFVSSRPTTTAPTPPTSPAPIASPKPTLPKSNRVAMAPPAAGQFDWRQVESEDYKKYIANLRAIGCPEDTIRDLIIADVTKFYFQRITPLAARARDFKYWQAGASRAKITAENRQQVQAIDREKWALLRDLLGADVEAEYRKTAFPADYLNEELTLGFLPDAKRAQVRDVVDRYAALERDIQTRPTLGMLPKDRTELKKIRDQRQAELAKLLTPQELEEYDLRNSSTADTLRTRLASFQPTEEQFRQMFRTQKAYDDEYGSGFMVSSPAEMEKRVQAQKQMENQMKTVLGDQTYADYKRAQDPSYRGLVETVRDFNLPPDTANQVYEIKKAVDEQVKQILDTQQSMPRDERLAAFKAVSDETEKALVQALGRDGYEAYKQNGGSWASWTPSENGGTFTFTSNDGNNYSVRSFKMGDSTSATGQPSGNTTRMQIRSTTTP